MDSNIDLMDFDTDLLKYLKRVRTDYYDLEAYNTIKQALQHYQELKEDRELLDYLEDVDSPTEEQACKALSKVYGEVLFDKETKEFYVCFGILLNKTICRLEQGKVVFQTSPPPYIVILIGQFYEKLEEEES